MADFDDDRDVKTVIADGFDLNQVAGTVILPYTPPTGRTALVTFASFDELAGTATVGLFFVRGASKVEIDRFTVDTDFETRIALEAGDIARWEIIVDGGSAALGDFILSVEERGPNRA